jgi:anti-anti-sigma factor
MLGELLVQGAVSRLRLHGDLDLVTVEELRRLLADACTSRRDVVIDLADVPFVDVLSLSAILAAADGMREHGGRLRVTGAAAPVRRVCALLNADDVLVPEVPMPRLAAL